MKISNHHLLFQHKKNWKDKVATLKFFGIKHETEILQFAYERTEKVCDYNGQPIYDRVGKPRDLFKRLYSVKYQTKLRILPA